MLLLAPFAAYQNCAGTGFNVATSKSSSLAAGFPSSGTIPTSSSSSGSSGSSGSGFVEAAHPALPTMAFLGGRVLNTPKIRPIFFAGDTLATGLSTFLSGYAGSPELLAAVREYGGSNAVSLSAVNLGTAAPATVNDAQVQAFISNEFKATGAPIGAPDLNTIYTIYYPETTVWQDSSANPPTTSACTEGIAGYHNQYVDAASGTKIVYAVIVRCAGFDTLASLTATSSHEIVETITDPDNNPLGYYNLPTGNANVWSAVFTGSAGSEVGDMCEGFTASNYTPSGLNSAIQSSWSNAAAAAGQNPCQPTAPNTVYFNSGVVATDAITFKDPGSGAVVNATGVKIPLNSSKTVQVQLFSTAATPGPWTITTSQGSSTCLKFSADKSTGQNGDIVNLTITATCQVSSYAAEPFVLISTLNGVTNYWPVMVGN